MTVQEAQSYLLTHHPTEMLPICVGVAKDGQWLVIKDPKTGETKEVYDAISGAACSSLPHNDQDIISQYIEFANTSTFARSGVFTNMAAEKLAKLMVDKSEGVFKSARFVCSGSEANDNAFRIIKQYFLEIGEPKRHKFISRMNSYHGVTVGALSVGDKPDKPLYQDILLSAKTQSIKISPVYQYRYMKQGQTEKEYCKELLKEAEQTIIDNDPATVAAIVVETMSGSSLGTTTPPPGYLDGLRSIAYKYGALMMCDEVMCGLGRGGYPYTFMHPEFGFSNGGPDIMTFGKTVGAGQVSLSGIMVGGTILDAITKGSNVVEGYQTFHAHYFNCCVGLAVQEKIHKLNLIENVRITGAYLKQKLADDLKKCEVFGQVRGAGNFLTVEIVKDRETKEPFSPDLNMYDVAYKKLYSKNAQFMCIPGCAGHSIVDGKVVSLGDHISMAPAFTFTEDDCDFIVKVIKETLEEIAKEYL